jgi:hypothetical protein
MAALEITMCCLVDEDLAWCLLHSVHRKSSHSGHQVAANLDRDDHRHCQELRPILEVAKNAKSSTAIVHIERDLEHIDAAFEKMKSDITNNSQFRLVVMITDVATLCCCCCHVSVSENKTSNINYCK